MQSYRRQFAAQEALAGKRRFLAAMSSRSRALRSATAAGGDRMLLRELPRRGARTSGKRKQVQVGEGLGRDKREALFKEGVGLAGKAHHHVRADGGVRHGFANQAQFFGVVPGTIAAMHGAEDGVGSGLQGQMGVARQAAWRDGATE